MKNALVIIWWWYSFDSYQLFLEDLKYKEVSFYSNYEGWIITFYKELSSDFNVLIPSMPNKSNAKYKEWKIVIDNICKSIDISESIFVWHSLWWIFLAKYFSESKTKPKRLDLVAVPFKKIWNFSVSEKKLLAWIESINLWISKDDSNVNYKESLLYRQIAPQIKVNMFESYWHFWSETFNELMQEIKLFNR